MWEAVTSYTMLKMAISNIRSVDAVEGEAIGS